MIIGSPWDGLPENYLVGMVCRRWFAGDDLCENGLWLNFESIWMIFHIYIVVM